ncbi:hypothetical protein RIF29_34343 [Crotalaria pallida]|uniref:Reverse transcriptase n=1 Tax=Crotalaria pallida TaxID=3830 RepID=A0AAN9HUM3_CROPI
MTLLLCDSNKDAYAKSKASKSKNSQFLILKREPYSLIRSYLAQGLFGHFGNEDLMGNPSYLHPYNPEIDRTYHRLVRQNRNQSIGSESIESLHSESASFSSIPINSDSYSDYSENMAQPPPRERTLRELAAPDFTIEDLCIQYPDDPYELRSGLIHLLPKFNGLTGEDPHKHLKQFHIVCATMKPHDVQEDHVCLKAFPHSLEGLAKDWLYDLAPGSITVWDDLKRAFLEKFFPAYRTTAIRKDISGIRQQSGESLYEYWERFKRLCASCPHHQISEQLLIQYFYEGLNLMERNMLDAASGGALGDMTPLEARVKIEKMASNCQQFHARGNSDSIIVRGVNDVGTSSGKVEKLEQKIDSLTTLQQPTTGADQPEAYAANIFNSRNQQPQNFDLSTNRYNPGWRNHPNLRWSDQQQPSQVQFQNNSRPPYVPPPVQQQRQQQQANSAPPAPSTEQQPSLEELMKQMTMQNLQFQQETRASIQRQEASIQSLTNQMGQMATAINTMQSQNSNKLPSQTVINPNQNVNAISLRSGKQIVTPTPESDLNKDDLVSTNKKSQMVEESEHTSTRKSHPAQPSTSTTPAAAQQPPPIPLPFPPRGVTQSKKMEEIDKEILGTFRKVEVNIPLLDAIKQIPRYAKFLKDLCTHKWKLKGNERINMGRNVSALIGKPVPHIPEKCKDPGTFSVPCIIGNTKFENALLDLGAYINVMPMSVFKSLSLGPLQPTGVVIHLANRSTAYPAGLIEDVLVRVEELIFPADFYILDMEEDTSRSAVPIILGRPFLKTARTKIDVHAGTLSMEFDDSVVRFNIFDAMKHFSNDHSVFHVDLIDDLIDEHVLDFLHDYDLPSFTSSFTCSACSDSEMCTACIEIVQFLNSATASVDSYDIDSDHANPISVLHESNSLVQVQAAESNSAAPLVPSVMQAPLLDLKPLPPHLKYAYLEAEQKLPVIISTSLSVDQEKQLLDVIRANKRAIGWTLADIPGISPFMCMHRILLEDGAKPVRQPQRQLNPQILDVVKKEVTKLLQAGIIYPISDSTWVSPVQVVPKKSGVTVVKNEKDELIPTRVKNSWRVCIDYRKLNQATRKDHFPLPFIDQMLERLAGKSHYCFLDGFSGYFQICIAPEDQHKTTFTCPFGTFAYRKMPFGLCNAPGTFQRCMMSIFNDLLEHCIEVFMDDFSVYGSSFDACLDSLSKVLNRCIETNLVLNFEKCHFMVEQGIVLGHIISHKGIEVDPAKLHVISHFPYPSCVREVRSFLGHAGFYRRFIQNFSKIALPLSNLLQKDATFDFGDQ